MRDHQAMQGLMRLRRQKPEERSFSFAISVASAFLDLAAQDTSKRWFLYHVGLASSALECVGLSLPPFRGVWPEDRDSYLEKIWNYITCLSAAS
ncbi:MAG: hypothetical protein QXY39_06205 [Thermofilaceae archaeon]